VFIVWLNVWENAGMPENCRLMMDYEYQGKRKKSISSNGSAT
jgi:hypothetical protein